MWGPLPLLSGQQDVEQDGSPAEGREEPSGWDRRGCAPELPLADQRLALCVSLVCQSFSCLSVAVSHATAPAAWEPPVSGRPASPLWSERGAGGHAVGPNAAPAPGGGNETPVSDGLLLCPECGHGLCSSTCQRGGSDQARRSVGRAGSGPFRVGALSIPLSAPLSRDPGTDRLSAWRPFACARERGQTAEAVGAAQEGRTVARRLPVLWLSERPGHVTAR